ncbi:inactive protein RESTRICTED TEV MOVEMENT 2-like [Abrus precatorius]|uniref:Inactive protein RESTRICTED TEV MOVEMENT 2-like n=1 Tax=Abrus precatorius TaxID=3816 RepID=A0A8B8MIY2_ABRPR|nr:inactive protein RESTRICTED TEV MOVEMENT 2-like [Abrus precatorius]
MSVEQQTDAQTPSKFVYEEFQPPSDWDHDKESDTLILMLPGFRKDQLRVQVSSNRVLRVSGERKISENKGRRFRVEIPVSETNETNGITAKYEAGMLYVRIPKVMKPPATATTTTPPTPTPTPTTTATPTTTQEPSDDHTQNAQPSEIDKAAEHSKAEPQTQPHEPKAEKEKGEDSQKEKHKEEETDTINNKTFTDKVQETTQQTPSLEQKEDHEEYSRKKSMKENGKVEKDANAAIAEAVSPKAEEKMHGTSTHHDELGKSSFVKMITMSSIKAMICGLVDEVKKQNKLPHVVAAIFLLLMTVLYIKNVVKSSFGGPKSHDEF